jgi:hypothetical protein
MISIEEIQKYLPQYLSAPSQHQLFDELRNFPENIDKRLYSESLLEKENIFQGDGIARMLVSNLPSKEFREMPAIVLSNTCDIDIENKRLFPSRIVYAPIFLLVKYRNMLIEEFVKTGKNSINSINAHISAIKRQEITQILYLPQGGRLSDDSIVFLDRLNNYPADEIEAGFVKYNKLFTLSNYGFYLFIIKLSIHFTRIQERVDRMPS